MLSQGPCSTSLFRNFKHLWCICLSRAREERVESHACTTVVTPILFFSGYTAPCHWLSKIPRPIGPFEEVSTVLEIKLKIITINACPAFPRIPASPKIPHRRLIGHIVLKEASTQVSLGFRDNSSSQIVFPARYRCAKYRSIRGKGWRTGLSMRT